jgi:prevent-host-death family protein
LKSDHRLAKLAKLTPEGAMQVNIHTAKTHLSKLIEAALNGEEVVIARGNRPMVKIVPVGTRSGFKFGVLKGIVTTVPEFGPMSDEELDELERRDDDLFAT